MQRSCNKEAAAAIRCVILSNAILGFASASAEDIELGKIQYQASCAACHGADANGDGPVSKELKTSPADLTALAKNNNGVFPYDRVYQMIDGRNSMVASHGTREMPVWGYRFGPAQAYRFKARVLAVIDYLKTVQQK
jgi:mono/diheme cytochrome c family protein